MLGSYVLGQRHQGLGVGTPYESGILPEGSARVRFSARVYLIAMFFVVFDLEAVFLFAWAVAAREAGWPGYWEVVIVVGGCSCRSSRSSQRQGKLLEHVRGLDGFTAQS